MGTGIYRSSNPPITAKNCVPCGYRDIPLTTGDILDSEMRSLWVQGYTGDDTMKIVINAAFPVGTGIYRHLHQRQGILHRVPCGYRDIPYFYTVYEWVNQRSLWVQGYTRTWYLGAECI